MKSKKLYGEYGKQLLLLSKGRLKNETNNEDVEVASIKIKEDFVGACYSVCPNTEVLTNIMLDVCYTSNKNKSFVWDIVGEQIFKNVCKNNKNNIQFPIKDDNGDIEYCGNRFSILTKEIGGEEFDNS